MPSRDRLRPLHMERVALVAPQDRLRPALADAARSGVVELDLPYTPGDGPDELDRAQAVAATHGPVAGVVGWVPSREVGDLAARLAVHGAALVPLTHPRGVQPPTLIARTRTPRLSRTLVDTYGTVPYQDVDPARAAGLAYVVMVGMMFGDVGHGAVLVGCGLLLHSGRVTRLRPLRRTWPFVTGAGLVSMGFGALYGEMFGPTGIIPVLWLDPLAEPVRLLLTALGVGAVLLAGAYTYGTINRVREGGWGYALYARSGLAGSGLFLAAGLAVWGLTGGVTVLVTASAVIGAVSLALVLVGLFVESGGGATGVFQAVVEGVDTVLRLGSNIVSFARLAAFGLTHAALLSVVWDGTTALWGPGWRGVAAVLLFLVGNALTFVLEALVVAIQALRLEYYELFSRVFLTEGRAFRPWTPALGSTTDPTAPTGSTAPPEALHAAGTSEGRHP
ncbi:V-type ATPase 116kDa subunit family protein [Cellulomonas soli]|uniref:V-type ATPase 116kDa subunit family protein n=1 Tax=Cellulomonas soli TaxID=931535 RepID=UPI003F837A15